jgi:hypothetical protein
MAALTLEIDVKPVTQADGCSITTSCGSTAITCSGRDATIDDACAFATGPNGTVLTCGGDDRSADCLLPRRLRMIGDRVKRCPLRPATTSQVGQLF